MPICMIQMDDFDVVAIDGKGVFVVDGDGHAWKMAPHCTDTDHSDKLRRQYAQLVYND